MSDETTEIQDESPRYAGFMVRLYAALLDMFLTLPIVAVIAPLNPTTDDAKHQVAELYQALRVGAITAQEFYAQYMSLVFSPANISISLLQMLIVGTVVIIFWLTKEATPGKMVFALRVVDANTLETPSKKQAIIRFLGYILAGIPFFLGYIWVAFSKRKRGWHDMLANTVVIHRYAKPTSFKDKEAKRQVMIGAIALIVLISILMLK